MASVIDGGLLPADILILVDSPSARALKQIYSSFGLDIPGESSTLAVQYTTGRKSVVGDGTTSYPGLANSQFKQIIATSMERGLQLAHYDGYFQQVCADYYNQIDNWIRASLPSGWSFTGSGMRMMDMHLSRMNANHSYAPATPATAATLVATTGGSRPTVSSGNAMRMKWALVGDSDWKESQPSPASTQVALSGANSAYKVDLSGVAGSIPTGVRKIRIYGQVDGSAGGDPYFWIKDVSVTEGTAYSTFTSSAPLTTITEADAKFYQSWRPASFAQAMVLPEGAFCFAISQASAPIQAGLPYTFTASCMLSPNNVCLNPISGFLGVGNRSQHGTFATWDATTSTYGTIATANVYGSNLQGFVGASNGIQARVTSALNSNASISNVGYTYTDANNPVTPTSGTLAGPFTLVSTLGSTISFSVPAGRIVRSVTGWTVGTATTGTFICEAIAARSI